VDVREPHRAALGEQISGQERISRPSGDVDIQIRQRRRQTQPGALTQHRHRHGQPRRLGSQPSQPGQHRSPHLVRKTVGHARRLRRERRYTVCGQIQNQLMEHEWIASAGFRARGGERRVGLCA
jgi:hypothetical protein